MNSAKIKKLLESSFWPEMLETNKCYSRLHDDHDGTNTGHINVTIDTMGDVYLSIDPPNPFGYGSLRFRTWGGGGVSLRTRNALLILAEAIRLDNETS